MDNSEIEKYNSHAKYMAEIALNILQGNKNTLDATGAKEIIALYLMIPYMTKSRLDAPDKECIIPMIDTEFYNNIKTSDLRDAICHSFVTAEENSNQIVIDDRAKYEKRSSHEGLKDKSGCVKLPIEYANRKLTELCEGIVNQPTSALCSILKSDR